MLSKFSGKPTRPAICVTFSYFARYSRDFSLSSSFNGIRCD